MPRPKKQAEKQATHKKRGRRPMTATQKKASQRRIAAEKKQAAKMVPAVLLQYQGIDTDITALVEAAKAEFKAAHKRTRILSLQLYLKPEERAAYYVVNGDFEGKLTF